jgi:hypothetical protein
MTDMFEYDYKNMGYDKLELKAIKDLDYFGIGVLCFCGYDIKKQAPIVERIHPRALYMPSIAEGSINGYQFFGFDRYIPYREVKNLPFKNKNLINSYVDLVLTQISQEEASRRSEIDNTRYNNENGMCTLYYHYFLDQE